MMLEFHMTDETIRRDIKNTIPYEGKRTCGWRAKLVHLDC